MTKTVSEPEPSLIPTRYSLLSRLQNWDDQASWKIFFDTYWRLIYSFALKSGLTETEAQEVVQETIIAVAKDIHKFKRDRSRGTFKGWLRNLARWRIADQLRLRTRRPAEGDLPGATMPDGEMAEIPDPAGGERDEIWETEWQSNLFDSAVERIKHKIKEEHFQIFDLHVIRQWPASRVAETLGISASRVYLVKFRVVGMIKKEIRRMEKEN